MSRPKPKRTAPEGEPDGRAVAIYMRVKQGGRRSATQESDLQRWSDLKKWADDRGRKVRWYKCSWSGPSQNRPGWNKLIADVEAGKVGTLVCWRLDRLGKTCSELIKLFEFLAARRVNLVSVKDGLDLSTPTGRRMASVLASVAVYESEVRAERIIAGQEAARARGVRWGGSLKGRRLTVTPELEATIRRLKAEGTKISQIARETGLSRPTVYKVLRDEPREDGPEP